MSGTDAATDADTVGRVLRGDVDAFETIVRRWQSPLVNLAYRYCRDRREAEDMAQEAFLRVYRGLRGWRGEGRFSTWLFGVAVNSYRSHLRRGGSSRWIRTDETDVERIADDRPADPAETAEWVRRVVTRLPPRYRDAVVVFYFREKDLGEAAAILGVPRGTLKARLHRARKLLRLRIENARKSSDGGRPPHE